MVAEKRVKRQKSRKSGVPGGEARRGGFQLKSNGFWLAATEGRRSGQDEKNLEKSDPGRGKKESGAK